MEKFFAHATQANIMADALAFLDYLAAQPDVKPAGSDHDRLLHGWLDVAGRPRERTRIACRRNQRVLHTAVGSRPTLRTARTCSSEDEIAGLRRGRESRIRSLPRRHEGAARAAAHRRGPSITRSRLSGQARLGVPRHARLRRRRCERHWQSPRCSRCSTRRSKLERARKPWFFRANELALPTESNPPRVGGSRGARLCR